MVTFQFLNLQIISATVEQLIAQFPIQPGQ